MLDFNNSNINLENIGLPKMVTDPPIPYSVFKMMGEEGKHREMFELGEKQIELLAEQNEQLKANFNTTFNDKGDDSWELILNPKDSTIASVMQTLTLGGRNYATEASIDSIVMTEASGNTIRYDFINQTYPEELTQNEKDNFGS